MRRLILGTFLAFGVLAGYGSFAASMLHHGGEASCHEGRSHHRGHDSHRGHRDHAGDDEATLDER